MTKRPETRGCLFTSGMMLKLENGKVYASHVWIQERIKREGESTSGWWPYYGIHNPWQDIALARRKYGE